MSAPVEIFEVILWQRTGERSAMGSGEPKVFFGWPAAARFARKWMQRGPDYYASIGNYRPIFSERRAVWLQVVEDGGYWRTGSVGGREWGLLRDAFIDDHGGLDAPDFCPAGALHWVDTLSGGFVGSVLALRGGWRG